MKQSIRKKYNADPYYSVCYITGLNSDYGKIDWHHAFRYRGRQVDELIVPVSHRLHVDKLGGGSDMSIHNNKESLHGAQYEALRHWLEVNGDFTELENKYPKKQWRKEWSLLNDQFGS